MGVLRRFYDALGFSESSGNYGIENDSGYLGKYQMGEAALKDAGYYDKQPDYGKYGYSNKWDGKWTGKHGIKSKRDFMKDEDAQEEAQREFKERQWSDLKKYGADKYVGKEVNGIKVTESGLLGAAHLGGAKGTSNFLKSNGQYNPDDGRTKISDYLGKFSGYDVSEITNPKRWTTTEITKMKNKDFTQRWPDIRRAQRFGRIENDNTRSYLNNRFNSSSRFGQ